MAETEEVAFDNWEDAFDDLDQNKQEELIAEVKKEEVQAEVTKQENKSEVKEEPVDPRKVFLDKLEVYKNIDVDKFEQYFDGVKGESTNKEIKVSTQILKSEKDFSSLAKKVGKVFNDKIKDEYLENVDDQDVYSFFQETLLLIYNQFEWKGMEGVKDKLKIVKKEKKDEEKKAQKEREREERLKKQAKAENDKSQSKSQKAPEDDIFGGAALINSKQVEDELKGKGVEPKVEEVSKAAEEDDDDFM